MATRIAIHAIAFARIRRFLSLRSTSLGCSRRCAAVRSAIIDDSVEANRKSGGFFAACFSILCSRMIMKELATPMSRALVRRKCEARFGFKEEDDSKRLRELTHPMMHLFDSEIDSKLWRVRAR